MDQANVSLLIANMFLVSAFIVDNIVEWTLLLIISLVWFATYLYYANKERKQPKK